MNILLINGSPKGSKSNTYRLTTAFLDGIKQEQQDICMKELSVSSMNIKPCLGCFSCWNRTPGHCCIQDDMPQVIEDILWADITIWSFPLYYFTVPGSLKNLIDRQLPMLLPFMEEREGQIGNGNHPYRYDMSGKSTVVISTCGFYTAEGNYDGIYSLFNHLCGQENYTTIFCGQGELFHIPEMSTRTNEYLSYVKQAGKEYIKYGISKETRELLNELLIPRETFEACADASWGIEKNITGEKSSITKKETDTLTFTRQMASFYSKENYPEKDIVLEMCYTDVGEVYQILLDKEGSHVYTDGSLTPTTKIETPVTVWRSIASGEIRGDEAMMKGLYRVTGDFTLMLKWDTYFGGSRPPTKCIEASNVQKKTNMSIMLIPWIVLWTTAAINKQLGCFISIGVCAIIPLIFYRNKKTIYDILTNTLVISISIIMLTGVSEKSMLPLSYFIFSAMWIISCIGNYIPLTANYSMNSYGGKDALKNALFLKTNRILTMLWGILYLFTSIFTWFLMRTSVSSLVGLINSLFPIFMGLFTIWFQKWYPAKVAKGK